jgi:hypothetical protein
LAGNLSRAGFLFKVVHERVLDSDILGFRGGLEGKEKARSRANQSYSETHVHILKMLNKLVLFGII